MEFETNSQNDNSPDISDEMRLAASSRVSVVTPLHEDIAPDELTDETSINQRILEGPIANIPIDSETTAASAIAAASVPASTHRSRTGIWLGAGALAIASIAAAWLILPH